MKYLICLLLVISAQVMAKTDIYVTEDESGNKTYSNTPPLNPDKAKTIEVDTSKTTQMHQDDASSVLEENDAFFESLEMENEQQEKDNKASKPQVLSKQERIERAEKRLEEAKQLKPGDYIKNVNGSIRYKPEYLERVEAARKALEEAKN